MLLFVFLKTRGAVQLQGVAVGEVFTQQNFTDPSWLAGQSLLPRGFARRRQPASPYAFGYWKTIPAVSVFIKARRRWVHWREQRPVSTSAMTSLLWLSHFFCATSFLLFILRTLSTPWMLFLLYYKYLYRFSINYSISPFMRVAILLWYHYFLRATPHVPSTRTAYRYACLCNYSYDRMRHSYMGQILTKLCF